MVKRAVSAMPEPILSAKDGEVLRSVGFTKWEVNAFASGESPIHLYTGTWRDVLSSRMDVVDAIRRYFIEERGSPPSRREIDRVIMNWYHSHVVKDPWIWVHLAYKPPEKLGQRTNSIDRLRISAKRRTKKLRSGNLDILLKGINI